MNTTSNINSDTPIASSDATIAIEIKDINVQKIAQIPGHWHKHYVQFEIDGVVQTTGKSQKVTDPIWLETFSFNATLSSVLTCRLYQSSSRIGRVFHHGDQVIGVMKESFHLLLGEASEKVCCFHRPDDTSKFMATTINFFVSILPKIGTPVVSAPQVDFNAQVMSDFASALDSAEDTVKRMKAGPQGAASILDTAISTVSSDSFSATYNTMVENVKFFANAVDKLAEVHPYAKAAWVILSAIPKTALGQIERDAKITNLLQEIQDLYKYINQAKPSEYGDQQKKVVTLLAKQTTECAYLIRDYASITNFWKRTGKNLVSNSDQEIQNYQDQFKKLKLAFTDHAIQDTQLTVLRMVYTLEKLGAAADLRDMCYAKGARFDPDKKCLPGTRGSILDELISWIDSPDGDETPRVLFLTAMAGFGKSAIAHTIAYHFDGLRRLGSSYCFDQAEQENRRIEYLFSTISKDISGLDKHWQSALCSVVSENPALCTTQSLQAQFENFIVKPGLALTNVGPIVLVIDALDESGSLKKRKPLLDILVKGATKLPKNFRVLVTTRPEPDVSKILEMPHRYVKHKEIHTPGLESESNEHDLSLYIKSRLAEFSELETEWPNDQWCRLLVKSAEGLFQWAAVACDDITSYEGMTLVEHLKSVLQEGKGLDNLYRQVLKQAFPKITPTVMGRYQSVIGKILTAKEPLSLSTLSQMHAVKLTREEAQAIIQPLGCLLSSIKMNDDPIKPLHSSFQNFLTCSSKSEDFYIDTYEAEKKFALACLHILNTELHFNICKIPSSYKTNDNHLINLSDKISSQLFYSCVFFAEHLKMVAWENVFEEGLNTFMDKQFLSWLEVLSVTKRLWTAHNTLSGISKWLKKNGKCIDLIEDAMKFVNSFAQPIAESAPHIYLSALPFAPTESLIAKKYLPYYKGLVSFAKERTKSWPSIINVMHGHTNRIKSVAFSPDGKHIVSGSDDMTIRVWDAHTGNLVSHPFKGHTHINSVIFSPDGQHIISGSHDKTIRVWDVHTGNLVLGPFEGHIHSVRSVAFSPDGKHIVSGSDDMTLRVWDAHTGNPVSGPFKGHTLSVNSVAFSLDGKHIVSGSDDMTIRVWDAHTGNLFSDPFKGHTLSVNSVEFSADGKHIVSGSDDMTIRVWDAHTGNLISGPFKGHTLSVNSVAFSPDGKHIVSGSHDMTIRVWDVDTGNLVSGPFEGHTHSVRSVAFSPSGKHIVSGSYDMTIRVWDAYAENLLSCPFQGHTLSVNCVAFSPDRKHIASGSDDMVIRVWDAYTGNLVAGPFQGHTNWVISVAFSPDGQHIVSGSHDMTIRVWDSYTGNCVSGPFEGHTQSVNSVAFSPDGKHIISGSHDMTIRVWDAYTGNIVSGPFGGHTDWVGSVAFSPDGKHIVSGSDDMTIRVWDAHIGNLVSGPFIGHTQSVNSVAFSPDGEHIISGSHDMTIRICDAHTGNLVSGPFEGHTDGVMSVAFSPDGKYIISGSNDMTIRLWDAHTGDLVAGSFEGHTDRVTSVAFSSDGKHFVSGSDDMTIRVWDAHAGNSISGVFQGYTSQVSSNLCLAHGSHNKDLQLWQSDLDQNVTFMINTATQTSTGWVCLPAQDLLFWVPPWYRKNLQWQPKNCLVIAKYTTKLFFANFLSGTKWSQIQQDDIC